jgi:6-phosphofructokinase 2
MPRVVTFTLNPALDTSINVEQVVPERKLRADRPIHEPGGGGINVARVLHELGVAVEAHWTCGGSDGQRLAALLDTFAFAHHPQQIQGETREHLIVFETSTGHQFRFGTPGPALSDSELSESCERIAALGPETPYLVLSGSLPDQAPVDTYARLAAATAQGTRVVLDTSGPAMAIALQAGGIYLAKPNRRELELLSGRSLDDDTALADAAREWVATTSGGAGAAVVVVSLGASGALAVDAHGVTKLHAPAVKVRSAVGAGDSMVAGIVAGLMEGRDLPAALRLGVAAGAAAVMTPGTELCRRSDVLKLDAALAPSDGASNVKSG